MGHVKIIARPVHLRAASEETAKVIKHSRFDILFLDLSQHLNSFVKALAKGAPYGFFIERVRELGLVHGPLSSWKYEMEPILLAVRGILNREPGLELWCYKEPDFIRHSTRIAENIARLALRTSISGKINLEEWRLLIRSFLKAGVDALNEEARYIAERSVERKTGLCISSINGRALRDRLLGYGLKTSLIYPFLPYHFTPIEILTREIRRELEGSVRDDERVLQLIKAHVNFVREYVLASRNYDEAYFRWVNDKASWIKFRSTPLKIPRDEVHLN